MAKQLKERPLKDINILTARPQGMSIEEYHDRLSSQKRYIKKYINKDNELRAKYPCQKFYHLTQPMVYKS